jgi:spermidine synthase
VQTPAPNAGGISPWLRRFLFLTAMVNGAAIMVIEILGAKILAPFLGTSHFVWTAQIGVAMASLAVGYYLGGRWADSATGLGRLYAGMLGAAGYLVLVVFGVRSVAAKCLAFPLPVGALLASAFLFFVPLALLAMTCPFLVRFITGHLSNVGGTVGRLTALSTAGSFIGTALIGYVLIPLAPNSVTVIVTAATSAVLALVYFLVWGGFRATAAGATVAVLALGWGALDPSRGVHYRRFNELVRKNSNFGLIEVIESPDRRFRLYLNDYLGQNTYERGTRQSASLFTYALEGLATIYTRKLETAFCIGVGVGIVPRQLAEKGVKVDAAEINPDIIPVAERFFDFDPTRLTLVIGDGRQVMHRFTNRYDCLMLDAFLGDSSPSHLVTREAFAAMRDRLKPEGVLVINSFGDRDIGRNFFAGSLQRTLRAVFADVKVHASGNGNMFFVASPSPLVRHRDFDLETVHPKVQLEARTIFAGAAEPISEDAGIVLTDDFNPVEFHDARNRERFRRLLASSVLEL